MCKYLLTQFKNTPPHLVFINTRAGLLPVIGTHIKKDITLCTAKNT